MREPAELTNAEALLVGVGAMILFLPCIILWLGVEAVLWTRKKVKR